MASGRTRSLQLVRVSPGAVLPRHYLAYEISTTSARPSPAFHTPVQSSPSTTITITGITIAITAKLMMTLDSPPLYVNL
ncbi:hypothetical protein E2C01_045157 [Portunus trituberculatus]|uniref:Uncharacterized protein n=1 Tax=Portunus trituberculatus TaxID=210409 RepID=A0A5B7G222_PORTR|nr:hypothetical protein [Portunus trituberculatus]